VSTIIYILVSVYALCGLLFSLPFIWVGVKRIDPQAARGSWGFRWLIIPGTMAFWPLLLRRWVNGCQIPPEEKNSHRYAARRVSPP